MLQDLCDSRFVAWRLFVRDTSARYRQTVLGFLWALIPPLAVALGLTWATRANVIQIAETNLPYPAYVIISMTLWQTFVEAVNGPMRALGEAKSIISRINIPREALLLSKLADIGLNFSIKLVLIAAVFVWFGIKPSASALATPFALLALVAFGTSIGLFLAPLASLYEDIARGLGIGLAAWMFLTPVLYPVPASGGALAKVIAINPVTSLLVTVRELACGLPLTHLPQFAFFAVVSLILVGFGWVVFRLSVPFIIERTGN